MFLSRAQWHCNKRAFDSEDVFSFLLTAVCKNNMNLFAVTIFVFSILRFSGFTKQNVKKYNHEIFCRTKLYKMFYHSISYAIWGGQVVRRCWVNFHYRDNLLILIMVRQGPAALAVGAGGSRCCLYFSKQLEVTINGSL